MSNDLDLDVVPWSRRGSYMTITTNVEQSDHPGRDRPVEPGVYVCDVSGARLWRWNGVFRLLGVSGGEVWNPTVRSATPSLLLLDAGPGCIEVTWEGTDTLRLRASGVGLRLSESVVDPFDSAVAMPVSDTSWRLQMGEDAHFSIDALGGSLRVDAPEVRTGPMAATSLKMVDVDLGEDGVAELALTMYQTGLRAPVGRLTFDECVLEVEQEFGAWRAAYPLVDDQFEDAADHAAYVHWSGLVRGRGVLRREAMLMSKHWMNAVWSWDHCFNALGLARAHPEVAWDQFMTPFDHQDELGALPDIVHDAGTMRGFVKPPVHGWALRGLLAVFDPSVEQLVEAYVALSRWTLWWIEHRDLDHDGLCEYFHGCDSGQDDSTAFDMGFPAAGPDLAAFLVVQMDVLAEVAGRLGRTDDARRWTERSAAMSVALVEQLWDGQRFRARRIGDRTVAVHSESQLPYLPLVLGERLPHEVRTTVVDDLAASGLVTPFGLASESPDSPAFEEDGYWRGAIWPPTNLLIVDGLRSVGAVELAGQIADALLATIGAAGSAENYSAIDGRALRCPAYTWGASAFWMLVPPRQARNPAPTP